ncbi:MAG: hypothetical protein BEU04_01800 [Marine Group III euryarchaeote CG-Bathy1]|uniref:Uncharacterized protein n=1 Tax=Marine Group III euryarchaeote CG-Bathy1 TaxID=1889001 RepID=A0A1J5TPN2_9ARCH|nr:MAG: hypothetical protein BEU04_01800 [Marine Group III euryarchaeote CG-Bathy1]
MSPNKENNTASCDVVGCSLDVKRSISSSKIKNTLSSVTLSSSSRKAKLCKIHYKEFKKASKKDRKLEMLGR